MQTSQQDSGTRTLTRVADLYDPKRTFDVRWQDVEYRRDGSESWLARVYQPQGDGPFPALVEVHGGAWNDNDRTQNAPACEALAASGLVIASIDFHLGTQAPYPTSIADTNYATRWLKACAADFKATPEALGGIGFSSGGHMIMLSAMRPNDPRYAAQPLASGEDTDASVAYVIMGWPVLDPHARYLHAKGLGRQRLLDCHHRYFGDEATMQEANPQQILERGESVELPPALIVQGADDDVLSPRTAERFVEAYGKAGGIIELAMYPKAGHGYSRDPGPNTDRTMDVIKSFIARQLAATDRER